LYKKELERLAPKISALDAKKAHVLYTVTIRIRPERRFNAEEPA
jgi:hypothetical protein